MLRNDLTTASLTSRQSNANNNNNNNGNDNEDDRLSLGSANSSLSMMNDSFVSGKRTVHSKQSSSVSTMRSGNNHSRSSSNCSTKVQTYQYPNKVLRLPQIGETRAITSANANANANSNANANANNRVTSWGSNGTGSWNNNENDNKYDAHNNTERREDDDDLSTESGRLQHVRHILSRQNVT